jgi:hypothetical protein
VRYIGHTANSARASSLLASILEVRFFLTVSNPYISLVPQVSDSYDQNTGSSTRPRHDNFLLPLAVHSLDKRCTPRTFTNEPQELKLKLALPMDLPPDSKTMTEEFSAWLKTSAAIKPIVIVLDGMDQLEVADRTNLFWLPSAYPPRCRMYVSAAALYLQTTPSKKLERALRYTIRPLTDVYCTMMIDEFLGQYGKTLDGKQKERLLACPRTRNPFYLFVVLEELRFFGSFERLKERFEYYLNAADVTELFDKV